MLEEVRESYGWVGLDPAVRVRDQARQGARRSGPVGARGAADPGGAGPVRNGLRREAEGRDVLRAQDRHLHRRRARPRVADGDDPGRPHDAARAVRPDLHRRGRASRAGRSRSTARSSARWSGSSGSSSSTSRGRSRCGSRRSRRRSSRSRTGTWMRANELAGELRAGGVRFVEVDDSDNRMQNKIRLAQGQKVPYMLILGDREVEARTAAVRRRNAAKDEPQEMLSWAELASRLGEEVRSRAWGRGRPPSRVWQTRKRRHRTALRDWRRPNWAPFRPDPGPDPGLPCPDHRPAPRNLGPAGPGPAGTPRDGRSREPPSVGDRQNPRAILPRLPHRRLPVHAARSVTRTKGTRHQPRPARQPDDPCPPGPGPR